METIGNECCGKKYVDISRSDKPVKVRRYTCMENSFCEVLHSETTDIAYGTAIVVFLGEFLGFCFAFF